MVALSHLNSARTLERCLRCLQEQYYQDFKVVITDAGSKDGSIEIAQRFAEEDPRFAFKLLPGCTEGGGEKWAIDNYPADVILFTNSDIYTPPHWVGLHMAWHDRGYDMVGGKQAYVGDRFDFAWSYITPDTAYSELTQGLSLGFTNCSVSREFYDKIGGVDPSLWYGTDMDFFLRAILNGAKLALDPRLEVIHDHPLHTFMNCWKKSYSYGRIQVNLLRLRYGSRTKWPGYPRWVSGKYLLPWGYATSGVQAWKQQRKLLMAEKGNDGGLLTSWLFNRYWGVGIAYRLGALVSMVKEPNIEMLRQRRVTYGK